MEATVLMDDRAAFPAPVTLEPPDEGPAPTALADALDESDPPPPAGAPSARVGEPPLERSGVGEPPLERSGVGEPPLERTAPPCFAAWLLAPTARDARLVDHAVRFGAGLGLAALYGAALGVRGGVGSMLRHAVGVPAAPLAVAAMGIPALAILLTLFDAPLSLPRLAAAAARGTATSGLLLAGLAPAACLYVASTDGRVVPVLVALAGLAVAGTLGLGRLVVELGRPFQSAPQTRRAACGVALWGFALFATALALRVWWAALPILGGKS